MVQQLISCKSFKSLEKKSYVFRGTKPLGWKRCPWRWFLQASNTTTYLPYGMAIMRESSLIEGIRSWLRGMSQAWWKACMNILFWWVGGFGGLVEDTFGGSGSRNPHGTKGATTMGGRASKENPSRAWEGGASIITNCFLFSRWCCIKIGVCYLQFNYIVVMLWFCCIFCMIKHFIVVFEFFFFLDETS